jgi:PhnB protein
VIYEDVDKVMENAVANGAIVVLPLTNQFWEDRTGRFVDPAGYVWTIASRIEETTFDDRKDRWSAIVDKN